MSRRRSVHPHIRGAYTFCTVTLYPMVGSSPHTWGIHYILYSILCYLRFIPTYVGHTWCIVSVICVPRFIPTYVGHTLSLTSCLGCCSVHPHIRGAYLPLPSADGSPTGSSPHTWGIQWIPSPMRSFFRFIPTYVGHTEGDDSIGNHDAVHPHIRGAYSTWSLRRPTAPGSSPHTWGIHLTHWDLSNAERFIPTYVGHTRQDTHGKPEDSVHPHIRGAYA